MAPGAKPAARVALAVCLVALGCPDKVPAVASTPPTPVAAPEKAALSEAVLAPRPKGGEHFGLYLMGKKVGYFFSDLAQVEGAPDKARAVSEMYFKASVGGRTSERHHREERVYESKPNGKLLSFKVEEKGDGGDQLLEGSASPKGLSVIRKRPGQPNQILSLAPSRELIEDADQPRVAILRNKKVEGYVTDGQDLESYRLTTTVEPPQSRLLGGVKVSVRRAVTLSDKEKVPVDVFITASGEMVEMSFGQTMQALAEPESVAKRLDQVEVFGLTRIVLPAMLPPLARQIPGSVTLTLANLPDKFQVQTYRQRYQKRPDGSVDVTLSAAAPKLTKRAARPVTPPKGVGEYLKSSLIVESDNAEIQHLAETLVGGEKDAYRAALKINEWVYKNLQKDYGASADRATDVLRQKKGDCTEHSLLATSLMRAAGIPAKRVDGVVYMVNDDQVPALYWHEWVEVYVGEWSQMDPTFGQPVADATHFAVGEEGNAEITPLIGQIKVTAVR